MGLLTVLLSFVIVALLPLGQVFRISLGNGVALNPLDIGVCIVALVSLYMSIWTRQFPRKIIPLGLFILVGILGLVLDMHTLLLNEFLISLLYAFRFICFALLVLGVSLLSSKQKQYIWNTILVSGAVVVAAGFVQYAFYQSLWGVLYEGWDPHLYRMFSTFLDPNFSGPFFVLYFLLVMTKWFDAQTKKWKIVWAGIGIATFVAVVLSFSRGAYVDLGISALIYLFLKGYKKIAIGIPLLIFVLSLLVAFFLPYGEEKHLLRTASTQARLVSAQNALTIFIKNPVVGVGFNSYRYAQYRYHLLEGFNWQDTHSGAGANNSYVFILATTGILGGLLYGWFWFGILRQSISLLKQKKQYDLFFFASWIALLVSGVFENILFYPSIMVWLFVLLGLTD